MKNKLTYLDVLEETVNYYTKDPSRRAHDEKLKVCSYYTNDGKMCAVGRCMLNPKIFQEAGAGDFNHLLTYIPLPGNSINEKSIIERRDDCETEVDDAILISRILKNKYEHLNDKEFWNRLQLLHDSGKLWCQTGLTEKGKDHYNLLKVFCENLDNPDEKS